MQAVNWSLFSAKFKGQEDIIFQWLCYLLFCLEYDKPLGIMRYFNQPGLETDPIAVGEEWHGWQAKYYGSTLSNHKDDLIKSIDIAKVAHPQLTHLHIYTNQEFAKDTKTKRPPTAKAEIESHAKAKGITIIWKCASYFEGPLAAIDNAPLVKYFFSNDESLTDFFTKLRDNTDSILARIRSEIVFGDQTIKIDRLAQSASLEKTLGNLAPAILTGDGGVGKTAVVKDFYDSHGGQIPVFLFRGSELSAATNINDVFRRYGPFGLLEFAAGFEDMPQKCVVIDSAERLGDNNNLEVIQDLVAELVKHKWKVIFTTRRGYLEDLSDLITTYFQLSFTKIDVDNLTRTELANLAVAFGFDLPNDERMVELLCNPFYLNAYLHSYDSLDKSIGYQGFKSSLWNQKIANSRHTKDHIHRRREECFIKLARKRADEGSFFMVGTDFDQEALSQLEADEIVGYEASGSVYFITHDIYEEWGLERNIEIQFSRNDGKVVNFYDSIGNSLAMRRAFRAWLSDKLHTDHEATRSLIEATVRDSHLPAHWRDELLVSVLRSKYAKQFLESFESELLVDSAKLLIRLTFLLRTACRSIDDVLLARFGLKKINFNTLSVLYTVPEGSGWDYVIEFTFNHLDALDLTGMNWILNVLEDWALKHKTGSTTKYASLIALRYYEEISNKGGFGYGSRSNLGGRITSVILNGAAEIKPELTTIIDKVVATGKIQHRDVYFELAEAMLGSVLKSSEVAAAIPEAVIKLAWVFWVHDSEDSEPYGGMMRPEEDFGILSDHQDYFPASALQTPILPLLKAAPEPTLAFIASFTSKAVEAYASSGLGVGEVRRIKIYISPDKPVDQIASMRLWEIYRGSHVNPALLESVHMALEKWLIEFVKTASADDAERVCMQLLRTSESVSLTAIVVSAVLAQPYKLDKVALVLFKTKELFLFDTTRLTKDQMQKSNLVSLQQNFPSRGIETEIHENERIAACDDEHRKLTLEYVALLYQIQASPDDPDGVAERRRQAVWDILDEYYHALPDHSKQTDRDKTWRLYLARMDSRKMAPVESEQDGKSVIQLVPDVDPALKAYSESAQSQIAKTVEHQALQQWARIRWDKNESKYSDYHQYESDVQTAISETKIVIASLKSDKKDGRRLLDYSIPPYVCSVLLRDFPDKIEPKERIWCGKILLDRANAPLNPGFSYQVGEGTDVAIRALPLALGSSSATDANIQKLLLALLLDDDQHVRDCAIVAVLHEMTRVDPKVAYSLFIGFLILKPDYDKIRDALRKSNLKMGKYTVELHEIIGQLFKARRSDVGRILDGQVTYDNLPEIAKLDLWTLRTAFELVPEKLLDENYKRYIREILPVFATKLSNPDRHDRYGFELTHRFFEKFTYVVLTASGEEAKDYMKPFVAKLGTAEYSADLVNDLVSMQDKIAQHDEFWLVWELLYDPILGLYRGKHRSYDLKKILRNYLFAGMPWKETARSWHTFEPKDRPFFKKVVADMGGDATVFYAITKLLHDVGSEYLEDGIIWVSDMLEQNESLWSADLEVNTVYHLERVMRRYILTFRQRVKTNSELKARVIRVLDFLIEKGSTSAYLTREDIIS